MLKIKGSPVEEFKLVTLPQRHTPGQVQVIDSVIGHKETRPTNELDRTGKLWGTDDGMAMDLLQLPANLF